SVGPLIGFVDFSEDEGISEGRSPYCPRGVNSFCTMSLEGGTRHERTRDGGANLQARAGAEQRLAAGGPDAAGLRLVAQLLLRPTGTGARDQRSGHGPHSPRSSKRGGKLRAGGLRLSETPGASWHDGV